MQHRQATHGTPVPSAPPPRTPRTPADCPLGQLGILEALQGQTPAGDFPQTVPEPPWAQEMELAHLLCPSDLLLLSDSAAPSKVTPGSQPFPEGPASALEIQTGSPGRWGLGASSLDSHRTPVSASTPGQALPFPPVLTCFPPLVSSAGQGSKEDRFSHFLANILDVWFTHPWQTPQS